jgi:hypothetical protein
MDAKVTLSFDKAVIENAKQFANEHNISLSRLMEFLLSKITTGKYKSLEDFPVADWVSEVAEGEAEYLTRPRSRKAAKKEFFDSKR